MDSRPWHEQLRIELHQQGLPATYIDRLVEELADHAVDSQTENTSMDAQQACAKIGTTTELAAAARHEFDRRTFAGRYPVLTFVLGPIAFVPLLYVSCMLIFFGVAWVIICALEIMAPGILSQMADATKNRVEPWLVACFNAYSRFVPFVLAAWLYCRIGQRLSLAPWERARVRVKGWSFIACLITALIAGLLFTKSTPATATGLGMYTVGLTFRPSSRQLLQLLAPLAVAAWFVALPILLERRQGEGVDDSIARFNE
jgi:hypothetical protein